MSGGTTRSLLAGALLLAPWLTGCGPSEAPRPPAKDVRPWTPPREVPAAARSREMPWARTDDPARDRSEITRLVDDALDLREGMAVADVGAGAGYFTFRFARVVGPGGRVVATDADPAMTAILEREREARAASQVEVRHVAADHPQLDKASVDVIVMVNSIPLSPCHGPEPRAYLEACLHALRPRGRILIVHDARHTPAWRPPYGQPLTCEDPSGEEIAELAAAHTEIERLVDIPLPQGAGEPGVLDGFLLLLRRRD